MYCLIRRALIAPDRTHRPLAPAFVAANPPAAGDPRAGCTDYAGAAPAETVALLEAAAIALGAPALSPERIGIARAADRALRACAHDVPTAARMARLFHHTLLAACPNRHMLDLIESATPPQRARIDVPAAEMARVVDDHEAILDMIAAGVAPAEIERSLRRHTSGSPLCALGGR